MSDFKTPDPTVYKGKSGIARDSVWLTHEDLPHDKDVPVEIECVNRRDNVKFEGGRVKPIVLSLKFVGRQRELGLNATNRKILTSLFESSDCAAWFGKRILLHVVQGVRRPDNTVGPAVRIRAKRVEQKGATKAEKAEPKKDEPSEEAPATATQGIASRLGFKATGEAPGGGEPVQDPIPF